MRLRRSTLVAAAARRATGEQSERMPQWRSPKEQLSDAGERVATLIHGTRRQNCWLACRCGHAEAVCQNHRMDGVHDLGGMHGFGAIPIEEDEPLYHEPWEGRAAAITRHLMSNTTVDHFRWTIERMPPAEYLASRYNQRWLWAVRQCRCAVRRLRLRGRRTFCAADYVRTSRRRRSACPRPVRRVAQSPAGLGAGFTSAPPPPLVACVRDCGGRLRGRCDGLAVRGVVVGCSRGGRLR